MPGEQFAVPRHPPAVVVVGDVMLDDNLYLRYGPNDGHARRAALDEQRSALGGAGNVAVNVAGAGSSVALVGMIGDDLTGGRLAAVSRNRLNLHPYLFVCPPYRTPRKVRLYGRHTLETRIDDEGPPLSYYATPRGVAPLQPTPAQVLGHLIAGGARVVCTVDHGKGFLLDDGDDYPASSFQKTLRETGVPLIVDPKPNVNWPHIPGRNVILKMNHDQLNEVVGRPIGKDWVIPVGLGPSLARSHFNRVRADILASRAIHCDWLWLTYGKDGMSIGPMDGDWSAYVDGHGGDPVAIEDVRLDATGCGDTCTAVMAHFLATDGYTAKAILKGFVVANHAAGLASHHLGCHVLTGRLFEEICRGATATEDIRRVLANVA